MQLLFDKSKGYKPHVVREKLGLSSQKLRNWRKILDPIPTRPRFSTDVMLAYRIIKYMIEDLRFKPSDLKRYEPSKIFEFCSETLLTEIPHYYILISKTEYNLKVLHESVRFNPRDMTLERLYLDSIVNRHFDSLLELGMPDIKIKKLISSLNN